MITMVERWAYSANLLKAFWSYVLYRERWYKHALALLILYLCATPLYALGESTPTTKESAQVSTRQRKSWTPLHWACYQGEYEEVESWLQIDLIDIDQRDCSGATPLYIACQQGHSQIVALLLCYGVDVNQATYQGVTPSISQLKKDIKQ